MEAHFLSAISAGVADVRKVIERGKENRAKGVQTLLFLDEIHRFNKAQQDSVLGSVESGDIILIGSDHREPLVQRHIAAPVPHPACSSSPALSEENLMNILDQALRGDEVLKEGGARFADDDVKKTLVGVANGDARRNAQHPGKRRSPCLPTASSQRRTSREAVRNSMLYYDKTGDRHYDTISAFIKSLRGSDPDAAGLLPWRA